MAEAYPLEMLKYAIEISAAIWYNIYEVFDRYVWRVKKIWRSGTGIFQTAPWRTMI